MSRHVLVATGSPHKLQEIRRILVHTGLDLVGLAELKHRIAEPDEPYDSFLRNAEHKALHYARLSRLPALADDSGLRVDALGGAPGVRSKRFCGRDDLHGVELDQENNRLLLERLRDAPPHGRDAHYVCVAALARPDDDQAALLALGTVSGRIAEAPRGSAGFGYDPLFLIPEDDRTFAQMSPAEKHARSHRGRAFRAVAIALDSTHFGG